MKFTRQITIYLLSFITLMLSGCIEENPDLVNPPSNVETINIRFVNLASDFQSRDLLFDGGNPLSAGYSQISGTVHPPADSSFLSISKSSIKEFAFNRITKFSRNINFTYFALPSPKGDSAYKDVDTLIVLTTSLAMPSYSTQAYMKLFNAYPDSTVTFSLMVGCPNTPPLIAAVGYRQTSSPEFLRTGIVPISIIKHSIGGNELVGTYQTNLEVKGQYACVVLEKQDGSIGIFFLDEMNTTTTTFDKAQEINERFATIRTVNLSNSSLTAIKLPGDVIAQDFQSNYIGNYSQISACSSNTVDSLIILDGNSTTTSLTSSLEVLRNYTLVIADSLSVIGKKAVLVPPSDEIIESGYSSIRVINLAANYPTIDLSISSKSNPLDSLGYSAGISLAKKLNYGTVSSSVQISSGNIPLALFTTFSPVQLLKTLNGYVEADKNYLIVISNDFSGNLRLNLIEDSQVNQPLQNLNETSFIQIINSIARTQKINLTIGDKIPAAKLHYANTIATNLETTQQQISVDVNGKQLNINFTPEIDKRYCLVLTGDIDNPDYLLIGNTLSEPNFSVAQRRFVNASNDLPSVWVVDDVSNEEIIPFANLIYKDYTFYDIMDKAKRYTYYFYNPDTKEEIVSFDIDVTLGKRYILIFAGTSKNKFGYSVMQIQEY